MGAENEFESRLSLPAVWTELHHLPLWILMSSSTRWGFAEEQIKLYLWKFYILSLKTKTFLLSCTAGWYLKDGTTVNGVYLKIISRLSFVFESLRKSPAVLKQRFSKARPRVSSSNITQELVQNAILGPTQIHWTRNSAGGERTSTCAEEASLCFKKQLQLVRTTKLTGVPYYSPFILQKTKAWKRNRIYPTPQNCLIPTSLPTIAPIISRRFYVSETAFLAGDSGAWHKLPDWPVEWLQGIRKMCH